MTVSLSPPMYLQFFDPNNTGAPLQGGKLFTYIAGTSTKQATWPDSTQGVANSNPIILDSNGAAYVWIDPSLAYKFVLSPANDTDPPVSPLRSVDNIVGTITATSLTQAILGPVIYPRTPAEITAAVVPTNFIYSSIPYDIRRYGAANGNASATNKTALQTAITVATKSSGSLQGVVILVPADCHYGYKVTDKTTWPSFSGTIPITVYDYSQGESYSGFPTAYDGNQLRLFSYTPQTTGPVTFTVGLAGGATSATLTVNWANVTGPWPVTFSNGDVRAVTFTNGAATATWSGGLSGAATASATYVNAGNNDADNFFWRGAWAPNIIVGNDSDLSGTRYTTDNRRARFLTATQGNITWGIGQGVGSSATQTSEQLSNFLIQKFAAPGDTLSSINSLLIERLTGNWMFNAGANLPGASYHFVSTLAGFYQGLFENPFSTTSQIMLRTSNGVTDDGGLVNRAGQICLNITTQGDAISFDKANRRATFGASVQQIGSVVTYSASMTPDATVGNAFVLTATNGTAFTVNAPTGTPTQAMRISITIRNNSGGALGVATFAAIYKLSAWTQPLNGFSRTIDFRYDIASSVWVECSRTPADVPN